MTPNGRVFHLARQCHRLVSMGQLRLSHLLILKPTLSSKHDLPALGKDNAPVLHRLAAGTSTLIIAMRSPRQLMLALLIITLSVFSDVQATDTNSLLYSVPQADETLLVFIVSALITAGAYSRMCIFLCSLAYPTTQKIP